MNKRKKYAYIRVSTSEQNEARQVKDALKFGIEKENIYIDKSSGRNFNRRKYRELIGKLNSGDTLYIHSIDRLGRDYAGILYEWHRITRDKNVEIKVSDTPILNTKNGDPSLISRFIRDIVLLTLAFQAEQEYINTRARQTAGIIIAKEEGKHLGRPKKIRSEEAKSIVCNWLKGLLPIDEAMQQLGIKRSAFYNLVQELRDI